MTEGQIMVYYHILKDIDEPTLTAAVESLASKHTYPTVPTAGAIRQEAFDLTNPKLPAGEAWRLALEAAGRYGINHHEDGLASLPETVAEATRAYGWRALCDFMPSEQGRSFPQFRDIYDNLENRRRTEAALPASLRVAAIGPRQTVPLPPAVAGILQRIG